MTVNLNCFEGTTNELVSCSSKGIYKSLMHKFSDQVSLSTRHDYNDYIHDDSNHRQLSHSYSILNISYLYTLVVFTLKVYMYHRSIV